MAEKNVKRILVFGVQGSGKGTQAAMIGEKYNISYIATGDIFRYETKEGTDLGKQVKSYTDKGQLVPDELTNEVIANRLNQPDCKEKGFVGDGFPRNKVQQEFLNELVDFTHVFVIKVSYEEAISRLSGRLACKCGLSYHVKFKPPKVEGVCDKCGQKLFVRDDDKEEAIKERIKIYHQETEPLLDSYRQKGILHEINGEQDIDKVFDNIVQALES